MHGSHPLLLHKILGLFQDPLLIYSMFLRSKIFSIVWNFTGDIYSYIWRHCVKKQSRTFLAVHLNKHCQVFGKNTAYKLCHLKPFIFLHHLSKASALPGKTMKHRNRTWMLCYWFASLQLLNAWYLQYYWHATHCRPTCCYMTRSKSCNQRGSAPGCWKPQPWWACAVLLND